jgi:regulator of CtrA degradation
MPVPATTFFSKTYDEALALLYEARAQVGAGDGSRYVGAPPVVQLIYTRESMRLTARLTQIITWLLIQKAVHAGELDRAEAARPEHRLGAWRLCTTHDEAAIATLPPALQGLMERSYRLYVRVARLDDMVARDAASKPADAPA